MEQLRHRPLEAIGISYYATIMSHCFQRWLAKHHSLGISQIVGCKAGVTACRTRLKANNQRRFLRNGLRYKESACHRRLEPEFRGLHFPFDAPAICVIDIDSIVSRMSSATYPD